MALASPASRNWDTLRDGTEIGDDTMENSSDDQDKMFIPGIQPIVYPGLNYPAVGTPYYAPNINYPYVLNPMLNTMCTWRSAAMMPAMPVLQYPQYPNPNVPMVNVPMANVPMQNVPMPNAPYPNAPMPGFNSQPNRPVPNPNWNSNNGLNHAPNPGPNHGPNRGPNRGPQRHGNGGQFNGGRDIPKFGNTNQGTDLGEKTIEDKYIPTAINPYPAPIPGFYDQMGVPCNPYQQQIIYNG